MANAKLLCLKGLNHDIMISCCGTIGYSFIDIAMKKIDLLVI